MKHVAFTLAAAVAALSSAVHAAPPGGGGSSASGGPITIDQARADAGGITAGDAPGFPVTISQPGSYRLMGNLVVTDPNTTAIDVTAADVTIDLNGFAIIGPVSCAWPTLVCTPNYGTGDGIAFRFTTAIDFPNLAVLNGTVRGMGQYGVAVYSKSGALIERVRAISNRRDGINAAHGVVVNSISMANGGAGVSAAGMTVQSNFIGINAGPGVNGTSSTALGNNIFTGNLGPNIFGGSQTERNICGNSLCP